MQNSYITINKLDLCCWITGILILIIALILCICNLKKEEEDSWIIKATGEEYQLFIHKTPEEGLYDALTFYDVKFPDIVYAQALLETGGFTSSLCTDNNNLFGLYNSTKGEYHSFEHWGESVLAYAKYIQRRYKPKEDYYKFLQRIRYASDPDYISKLRDIVKYNDKRGTEKICNKRDRN